MDNDKRTAVTVGVLFIVATAFFVVGQTIYGPVLGSADVLDLAYPDRTRVVAGILIELVGIVAIPLTAVFFFPVLRRHDEALALSYIAIRIVEALPLLLVAAGLHATLVLSGQAAGAGARYPSEWPATLASIQLVSDSVFLLSVGLVFPVGSMVLNAVLYRTRLVPRLIAGWGFLGAALLLLGTVGSLFGLFDVVAPGTLEAILAGPIATQEMVFAVWLIARGLDTRRITAPAERWAT